MASVDQTISEAEAELYDRQIRLWGLEAQKRLRVTKLLVVGLGGLGAEVCKNIVLAGIKSITLMDHEVVTKQDFGSQFLITPEHEGKNRATASVPRTQELNPNVIVTSIEAKVVDQSDEFFEDFDIVCLTCCSRDTINKINTICHDKNIQFFAGDIFGFYGYSFTDLNEHHFVEEKVKKVKGSSSSESPAGKKHKADITETIFVKRSITFTRYHEAFSKKWSGYTDKQLKRTPPVFFMIYVLLKFCEKFGRRPSASSLENDRTEIQRIQEELFPELGIKPDFLEDTFSSFVVGEVSPVCAIVGGILGQEIIKAASQRDIPHNNFFFYDGYDSVGYVDCIKES